MLGVALDRPAGRAFGAGARCAGHATTYLRIAFLGTTPLLVMLATTGVLRGLQDTRTPLVVAVAGNALNIVLNLLLVYGVGSVDGLGHRRLGARLGARPGRQRRRPAGGRGPRRPARAAPRCAPTCPASAPPPTPASPWSIRTLTLRAALLVTTYAVTLAPRAATRRSTWPPTSSR